MNSWPRKLLLGFALVAPLIFLALVWSHPLIALGILFLSHILLLPPTLIANCQWWGPVATGFATTEKEIWLTIDDGPSAQTPHMLELLARFEAKATFFTVGKEATKLPAALEQIRAAGHRIANHTFDHPSARFWTFGPKRIATQIDRHPIASEFFRAPVGLKNFFLHPALAKRNMQLIGWSVRGLDTLSNDAEKVAERIRRRLRPGAIVLLHEGHRLAHEPDFHPRCLELTLRMLGQEGYRCVLPPDNALVPNSQDTLSGSRIRQT